MTPRCCAPGRCRTCSTCHGRRRRSAAGCGISGWHNVRQLDAVCRELLARLWAARRRAGGPVRAADDRSWTPRSCRCSGGASRAPRSATPNIRGYHPQLATLAETGQVVFCRLRGGAAGRGARRAELPDRDDQPGPGRGATGQLTVRADSALLLQCRAAALRRSSTSGSRSPLGQNKKIRAAIEAIPNTAHGSQSRTGCPPPRSPAPTSPRPATPPSPAPDTRCTVRLIVRRVRPTPGSQLALFTTFDYHAFVTDRPGDDARDRGRPPSPRDRGTVHRRVEISRPCSPPVQSRSWPTPRGSPSR